MNNSNSQSLQHRDHYYDSYTCIHPPSFYPPMIAHAFVLIPNDYRLRKRSTKKIPLRDNPSFEYENFTFIN